MAKTKVLITVKTYPAISDRKVIALMLLIAKLSEGSLLTQKIIGLSAKK